jgi:hypothetical protein
LLAGRCEGVGSFVAKPIHGLLAWGVEKPVDIAGLGGFRGFGR